MVRSHLALVILLATSVSGMALMSGQALANGDGSSGIASGDPASQALRNECEYGITLALRGETIRAESVFVSLLSHSPRDARALANLGNLHLLRGETEVAIAFYDRVLARDSSDAGILLNRATALLLSGDEEGARLEAAEGIALAGGTKEAASLLGIPSREIGSPPAKESEKAYVSRDEVRDLLLAATGRVPFDSTRGAPADSLDGKGARPDLAGIGQAGAAAKETPLGAGSSISKKRTPRSKPPQNGKRTPVWRSAGPRGAEDQDATAVLYWKR